LALGQKPGKTNPTIPKTRSHYLAEKGNLVQLMRGIYVDAANDVDQTVSPMPSFSSVRLAPGYDTLTTRVFPGVERPFGPGHQALEIENPRQ
jgi:hypothetical protein